MDPGERKIVTAALQETDKLTGDQKDFVEYLAGVSPGYRLNSRRRKKLYAIGKIFGIDGNAEFVQESLQRAAGRRQ